MTQLAYWAALREDAQFLGECLTVRFARRGGNPARKRLQDGETTKLEYELVNAQVELWDTFYDLIQLAWDDMLQANLTAPKEFPFKAEQELFFDIFGTAYDVKFCQCLMPHYQQSPSSDEKAAKLVRSRFWQGKPLTPDEKLNFERLRADTVSNFWFNYSVEFFLRLAKIDSVVGKKMRDFNRICADLGDLLTQDATRARKSCEYASYSWHDNQLLLAKRGSKYMNVKEFLTSS